MHMDEKALKPRKLVFKKFFNYLETCHVLMSDLS